MTNFLIVVTTWFIPIVTILIIGWDVYAFFIGGSEATISRIIQGWANQYQIIPYSVGVLASHLFWPAASLSIWWIPLVVLFCTGMMFIIANSLGYSVPISVALFLGLM